MALARPTVLLDDGVPARECAQCGIFKPLDEFQRRGRGRNGYQCYCIACGKERSIAYYWAHHEERLQKTRDYQRQLKEGTYQRRQPREPMPYFFLLPEYGIDRTDYARILEEQGGACAICGSKPSVGRRLSVDHDHETGQVRGLLCGTCNSGIGMLKNDPEIMLKAVTYIRMHETKAQ